MRIEILENEYWWGGIVNLAETMPYTKESAVELDIGTIHKSLDQSAPLFVSSKGRYIWSKKPFWIAFWHGEIRIRSKWTVKFSDEGRTLRDACKNIAREHYHLSGEIPEELFFNRPQFNSYIELRHRLNQINVLDYASQLLANGFSPGILMLDGGWQKKLGAWDFPTERFPDPKSMVSLLHEQGFKVIIWVIPVIDKEIDEYNWLKQEHLLLTDTADNVMERYWWGGYNPVLDTTNPRAVKWFTGQLNHLQKEYGIDGFKFDGGDAYFFDSEDATFIKCLEQEQMNAYIALGEQYPYHEFRCGYKPMGRAIVQRLQDKLPVWEGEGLNQLIPHSILQGMIGAFFHCPDMVGGGVGESDLYGSGYYSELYMRWVEASTLCPMMQFSIAPWKVVSSENLEAVKKLASLHEEMGPYILELAKHAAKTGEPIMRHMAYEFPEEGMEEIQDQYMLGDRVMAAPVLKPGCFSRSVKLPAGNWKADDGQVYEGGQCIEIDVPLTRLPYFIKQN